MSKKRIILHGHLKKLESRDLEFEAKSVTEALTALVRQCPAFKPMIGKEKFRVRVLGFETTEKLDSPTDVEEIHIVPDLSGRKSDGGVLKVVLGTVLVVSSFFIDPTGTTGAAIANFLFAAGTSLVIAGVAEILFPAPKIDTGLGATDPEASKYLGAPGNTTRVGTRIPIIYGKTRAYGHILSFDIAAKDVVV